LWWGHDDLAETSRCAARIGELIRRVTATKRREVASRGGTAAANAERWVLVACDHGCTAVGGIVRRRGAVRWLLDVSRVRRLDGSGMGRIHTLMRAVRRDRRSLSRTDTNRVVA
jgi:hypothetical protein